jgi:hypothetical protein
MGVSAAGAALALTAQTGDRMARRAAPNLRDDFGPCLVTFLSPALDERFRQVPK